MSQQLEYQECYHKLGHESVIKAMVLSPDGRRLVTGSEDSTVLVWSTQSGATLFRIKAHSPVLSLAWLTNSKGFIFGCKNGMLASVIITEVRALTRSPRLSSAFSDFCEHYIQRYIETSYFKGHSAAVRCISPKFNDISPITAAMDDVRIWTRSVGQNEGQGAFINVHMYGVIVTHTRECDIVERWVMKVKLDSPSIFNRNHEVEVTSVNWEDKVAAARVSQVLVSYRWHGIVYALKFSQISSCTPCLFRCWDVPKMTVLWHIPMDEWWVRSILMQSS
jgi:hypothetical protein